MALKFYKSLDNNIWDILFDFYEINYDEISFSYLRFDRNFCKNCGNVQNGINNSCSCNNTHKFHIRFENKINNVIDFKIIINKNDDLTFDFIVSELKYDFINQKELYLYIKQTNFLTLKNNKIIKYNKDYLHYIQYSNISHYEKYNDFIDLKNYLNLFDALKLLTYHQKIYEDIRFFKYPKLTKLLMSLCKLNKNENILFSYDDMLIYFYKFIGFEFYDLNFLENDNAFRDLYCLKEDYFKTLKSLNGLNEPYLNIWNFFKNQIEHKKNCYSSHNINYLIKDFQAKNVPDDYIPLFIDYYKEHDSFYYSSIISYFLLDINLLKNNNLEINKENLKLKNINKIKKPLSIKESLKIPEDKIELFVRMFDENPLESLELLKDRRQLTKKQIEQFKKKE